jgi:hypothetical protein
VGDDYAFSCRFYRKSAWDGIRVIMAEINPKCLEMWVKAFTAIAAVLASQTRSLAPVLGRVQPLRLA